LLSSWHPPLTVAYRLVGHGSGTSGEHGSRSSSHLLYVGPWFSYQDPYRRLTGVLPGAHYRPLAWALKITS
jgi:hypothetical protein